MIQTKLFVCLPILNESENLPNLLDFLKKQTYQNIELIACVNQPEEWWGIEEKQEQYIDNQKSIDILKREFQFPITIIDKSSRGKGWKGKQKGVGWARKLAMDKAAEIGSNQDLIVSIDADTEYPKNYFLSLIDIFEKKPNIVALSNPYFHRLTDCKEANLAILRYEIYMRNYAINMILIDNPYQFSALGSAMVTSIIVYKKMGGISPKSSGEDFYFLQKLSKYGTLEHWNECRVYPAARFSNRVNFGTGPAMIKGNTGDWSSYPLYHYRLFEKVESTYALFPNLFEKDFDTPMSEFLKKQLNKDDLWSPLRKNYKTKDQFIKACSVFVDGLRILQFLKKENENKQYSEVENLKDNLLYFSTIENKYSSSLADLATAYDLKNLKALENLRDTLANFEYSLRKLKSKY